MPIEIRDLDGGIGNLISGMGVVAEDEYVETFKMHLTQNKDKFKKYRYSLSDYTAVTKVDIATKEITLVANLCKSAAIVNPDAVVAVIANQDLTYGLARMWQILTDETGWELMVFRTREDAESWIKERVKEKYGIGDLTMA